MGMYSCGLETVCKGDLIGNIPLPISQQDIAEQLADVYLNMSPEHTMTVNGIKVNSIKEMFDLAFAHQLIVGEVVIETKLKE